MWFLLVNKYSRIEWDSTVEFITNIGLGGYMVVVAILLVFFKLRYAASGLLNLLVIGVFTNTLKELFKGTFTRPLHYFLYDDFTRFIYTADINYYSSFPSGHSMTIFGMLAFLAFLVNRRTASAIFFTLALLVGFSRIYLLQHFFLDVYAGAFLGICSVLITLWFYREIFAFFGKRHFRPLVAAQYPIAIATKTQNEGRSLNLLFFHAYQLCCWRFE